MNREETREVLKIISAIYPFFYKNADKSKKLSALELWASIFSDKPYELVVAALKAYITSDIKGLPPAPGQIMDKIRLMTSKGEMTEMEAWEHVRKAIAGGWGDFREAWERLPGDIREIVTPSQLKEWALTDMSQMQVIASNVMRSYSAKRQSMREYESLPADVRQIAQRAAAVLTDHIK